MKDVLLLVCVLAAFYLGHFPMKRLDRFLEKNAEGDAREPQGAASADGAAPAGAGRRGRDAVAKRPRLIEKLT